MVNKFELGMVIFLDISLERTTIDVCRKHTNTGQCVSILVVNIGLAKFLGLAPCCARLLIYSCFKKGCATKVYATKSKCSIGNVDKRLRD